MRPLAGSDVVISSAGRAPLGHCDGGLGAVHLVDLLGTVQPVERLGEGGTIW